MEKITCKICCKNIRKNAKAICCSICHHKVHIDCNHINKKAYLSLIEPDNKEVFYCSPCQNSLMPFGHESNQVFEQTNLLGLNQESNLENHAVNISKDEQKTISHLSKIILENTDPNNENSSFCNYYQTDDFTKQKFNNSKLLSLLHLNINSLQFHKNDLDILLDSLNLEFDIIAISETRLQKGYEPTKTIDLPSHNIESTPTATGMQRRNSAIRFKKNRA